MAAPASARLAGTLATLLVLAACGAEPTRSDALRDEPNAVVERVIDGDTILVHTGGVEERVRLIGIDTPESVKPGSEVECFGKEASEHASELLPEGSEVLLVRDVEARDRYGRLLAYVYRASDALFVNRAMVTDGFAQPATYPPNVAHTDVLVAAGRDARAADRGLWGECGGDDLYG
ncbi:MAG: thermonuclease family protein [Microthrixaceae bacterium]